MSPEQIELAARELCRLRGLDPDALADYPLPPIGLNWQAFIKEVRAFSEVGHAICAVLEAPPKRARKSRAIP